MRKEDKALIIERLGEQLKEYAHFYLVDVTGLNAAKTSDLRRKCFNSGIKMVVVKNTLLEKAFDAAETDYSAFGAVLKGTTAVLFSDVANAPRNQEQGRSPRRRCGIAAKPREERYLCSLECRSDRSWRPQDARRTSRIIRACRQRRYSFHAARMGNPSKQTTNK